MKRLLVIFLLLITSSAYSVSSNKDIYLQSTIYTPAAYHDGYNAGYSAGYTETTLTKDIKEIGIITLASVAVTGIILYKIVDPTMSYNNPGQIQLITF